MRLLRSAKIHLCSNAVKSHSSKYIFPLTFNLTKCSTLHLFKLNSICHFSIHSIADLYPALITVHNPNNIGFICKLTNQYYRQCYRVTQCGAVYESTASQHQRHMLDPDFCMLFAFSADDCMDFFQVSTDIQVGRLIHQCKLSPVCR